MAQPSNTFSTYDAKGIREDLSDIIYRVDPVEVPFQSNIGRSKAKQSRHEWQIQTLASATNANAVIQGDDATTDAATATVRVSNLCQISDKVASVTGTNEAVDKAGRDSEMAYQVLLKGLELRRDIEMRLTSNKASVVGGNTTAAECAGFEAWITSNVSRGTSGASGGFSATTNLVAAATDGTQRAFTEAMLKTVMQSSFSNAGMVARPTILQLGPYNKGVFSGFTGIADIRKDVGGKSQAVIVGAADVYVSNFGNLNVVPSVFQRDRTAMFYNPKYIKLSTLRPMKNWELAKTGDTQRRQILMEYTLEMCNEAACGVVADLTTA
jgi:hypothetical protein